MSMSIHRMLAVFTVFSLYLSAIHKTSIAQSDPHGPQTHTDGFFVNWSEQWLEHVDTNQRNYGMAVSDVDNDGEFEIIVAGFMGPNLVLKFNKHTQRFENIAVANSPFEQLRDKDGQGIGVGACDIDGDGREEIYLLNTNDAYAGISSYSDKLFKWRDGKYVDLFSDPMNANISARYYAGRSVACLDRYGIGQYGFVIASYARNGQGSFALIEMDAFDSGNDVENGMVVLKDNTKEAGLDRSTGGRGVVAGPILNDQGKTDLFFVNEGHNFLGNRGDNMLFQNLGNGSFIDVAKQYNITDAAEGGRGAVLGDFNSDSLLDIAYGNYDGPNKLYLQGHNNGQKTFTNIATPEFERKQLIRTVLTADFDNNGDPEILFNNINDPTSPQPNSLYTITSYGPESLPGISQVSLGDATEEDGYGTGAVYLDIDQDGMLELVIGHGEDLAQPIEVYRTIKGRGNNYLRVSVLTKYGAPARGASVDLLTKRGKRMLRLIDSGSGYLCQMEPVAHFGLGSEEMSKLTIKWPDSKTFVWIAQPDSADRTLLFYHPDYESYQAALKASNISTVIHPNGTKLHSHTEL